jgi:hypothetical protein
MSWLLPVSCKIIINSVWVTCHLQRATGETKVAALRSGVTVLILKPNNLGEGMRLASIVTEKIGEL